MDADADADDNDDHDDGHGPADGAALVLLAVTAVGVVAADDDGDGAARSEGGDDNGVALREAAGEGSPRASVGKTTLQEVSNFLKLCLNLFPRRIRAITERLALPLIFDAEDLGQLRRRKQRVAFGEAHPFGIEIAFRKVFSADRVVILFYSGVFTGLQHGDDVRLRRQLKQVVVVSRIGSERRLVALENFHLAVDREHLFDEGAAEMQQAQRKRSLVICAE